MKNEFLKCVVAYTPDSILQAALWDEIEFNYSTSSRHYHNLTHIENILEELIPYKEEFISWDAIVFAIAYHDIIYNPTRTDNEELSATIAMHRLHAIGFPDIPRELCRQFILATRDHKPGSKETNLFIDGDLSILGKEENVYWEYTQNIRKECSAYSDEQFRQGRTEILTQWLAMPTIFKCSSFIEKYEHKARLNMQQELDSLKSSN